MAYTQDRTDRSLYIPPLKHFGQNGHQLVVQLLALGHQLLPRHTTHRSSIFIRLL